jgi:hypothetical protein
MTMKAMLLIGLILAGVIIQPVQKQQTKPNPNEHQSDAQGNPVPPPPVTEQKTTNNYYLPEQKTWNWHDAFSPPTWSNWALVLVGIGGVIAALVTLCIIKQQTRHIARQAQSMRYQTTHLRNSVIQARRGAKAALLNAQAVLNSERPWILIPTKSEFSEIEQPLLFPKLPGEFRISYCNVWIKNFGRTPAEIIEQKIRLAIGEELQAIPDPAIYESKEATQENYSFPPNDKMVVQATFDPDGFISADDLAQITSKVKKTKYIWLCGYFKYRDTFGRINGPIYETRICYRWVYDAQSQLDSDIHKSFWIMAGPREYNRAT